MNYHGSLYFLGLLLGSLLSGFMSDRIGRIKWYRICILGISLCGLVIGKTDSLILHLITWLVWSSQLVGGWVCSFTFCSEIVPTKYRDVPGFVENILIGFSIALCSLLAAFVTEWRNLTFVSSLIGFLAFLLSWLVPESPRWLWSAKRYQDAIDILKFAVRLQGEAIEPDLQQTLEGYSKSGNQKLGLLKSLRRDFLSIFGFLAKAEVKDVQQKRYSVVDLMRHRQLACRMLLLSYHWIAVNALYYGLLFGAKLFKQQLHIYTAVQGAAGSVGCTLAIVALRVVGRKTLMMTCFFTAGCCFLIAILVPSNFNPISLVLAFLGKVSMQIIFTLCYIWTVELTPTVLRSSAIGFGSMTARFTGLAVPYISNFAVIWDKFPLLIYSLMSFSVLICSFMLPETRGRKLDETIEDKLAKNKLEAPLGEEDL